MLGVYLGDGKSSSSMEVFFEYMRMHRCGLSSLLPQLPNTQSVPTAGSLATWFSKSSDNQTYQPTRMPVLSRRNGKQLDAQEPFH